MRPLSYVKRRDNQLQRQSCPDLTILTSGGADFRGQWLQSWALGKTWMSLFSAAVRRLAWWRLCQPAEHGPFWPSTHHPRGAVVTPGGRDAHLAVRSPEQHDDLLDDPSEWRRVQHHHLLPVRGGGGLGNRKHSQVDRDLVSPAVSSLRSHPLDKQPAPTVDHRELYSTSHNKAQQKGIWIWPV